MKYAIVAYGSRGDVQPYIPLALGLLDCGHEVTLLAPENFKDFIEGYGVNFFPLHGNLEELIYSPAVLQMLKSGNLLSLIVYMQKAGQKLQPQVNLDMIQGCKDADILIATTLTRIWVQAIAEKFNKKWGATQLSFPSTTTKEYPFIGLPFFNFAPYNVLTYYLIHYLYWNLNKSGLNSFRTSLGLPTIKKFSEAKRLTDNKMELYFISSNLVARPRDWLPNIQITGFLTLPSKVREANFEEKIPGELEAWLQNGEKPIYIGFGSIPIPNVDLFVDVVVAIITKASHRVVFCTGWTNIPQLPNHPDLFVLKKVNHQWLFPKCNTAIIHGGAGTTAAALKAKIPLIIVSVFADQPWWGKIISDKQCGVHIPFKKLTPQKVLNALEITQKNVIKENAARLGEIINNENGLNKALDAIEYCIV